MYINCILFFQGKKCLLLMKIITTLIMVALVIFIEQCILMIYFVVNFTKYKKLLPISSFEIFFLGLNFTV